MMLKELFKFHSKEEDFRVKCLILILLGIALIINPANGYTLIDEYTKTDVSSNNQWDSIVEFSSVANCNAAGVTHIESEIYCQRVSGGAPTSWSHTGRLGCGAADGTYCGNGTVAISGCNNIYSSSWSVATLTIDFDDLTCQVSPRIRWGDDGGVYDAQMSNNFRLAYSGQTVNNATHPYWVTFSDVSKNLATGGLTQIFSGSPLPDAPVINDFTNDMSCYYPNQAIAFSSDVEGELEDQLTWTWLWEIYDGETKISEDTDPVEAIMTAPGVGVYDVQLTVTNAGGTDFLQKLDMINVTLAGNCTGINNWSPFPTVPTVTPTSAVFPTMTVPPVPFINQSGINEMVNESLWGNYSAAYRKYIDEVGDSVNQTVTGATGLVMTPFAFIVQGIAVVLDLFSTSLASLMTYTTIPLSITSRIINVMPWQMQSIITAGLAIDAIFLLVLGKG